jgi:hypothetical protein
MPVRLTVEDMPEAGGVSASAGKRKLVAAAQRAKAQAGEERGGRRGCSNLARPQAETAGSPRQKAKVAVAPALHWLK